MKAVTISIDVPDLERAIQFYTDGLGFAVDRRLSKNVCIIQAQGLRVYLLRNEPGSNPLPNATGSRSFERHWTPVHLDIEVDDLEATLAKAVAAGAIVEKKSSSPEWGSLAACADPFGHGFCIIQPASH